MAAAGAVARQGHDRLLARARQLHFTQRTWAAICEDPGLRARAESWPSRKTEAARALLEMLRTGQFSAPAPFELNATGYLTSLARALCLPRGMEHRPRLAAHRSLLSQLPSEIAVTIATPPEHAGDVARWLDHHHAGPHAVVVANGKLDEH